MRGTSEGFGQGSWGDHAEHKTGDEREMPRRETPRRPWAVAGMMVLCSGLGVAAAAGPAAGADRGASQLLQTPGLKVDKAAPMLLQADELVYDKQHSRVMAKGNVEIYYNDYAVQAGELIYDQKASTLTARGDVRIKGPDGSLINAENFTFSTDFRDGFIRSLKVVTKEDARIGAANAYRKDGETTVFERGVFTPCKPCESDPDKAPTWRIKAAKIVDKQPEGEVAFEDATVEFFGVPVVWIPYFSMPDPTVKRRSGVLPPHFVFGDANLGYGVQIPYYFALAPSYDLTLKPMITTKAGALVDAEWRQRLMTGAYKIDLSGAYDDTPPEGDRQFRGSIKSQGEFALNADWHWGWDVTAESDSTFRRFYKLDGILATDRVNKVYLEGLRDRNYFSASLFNFGGLTQEDNSASRSNVLPVIDYNYIFAEPVLGGEASFNFNAFSLSRDAVTNPFYSMATPVARDTSQVVAEFGWRRSLTDPIGEVITPFVKARGDIIHYQEFNIPGTPERESKTVERGLVTGGVDYRYPFVKHTENATHVIEPVGQLIVRPDLPNQNLIPNEDAQSLVLDDTLLFDIDKFSGYDRIETGVRANVGMQYTLQSHSGWSARVVGGESFQIAGDNPFGAGSGLGQTNSDYVTGVYLNLSQHMSLIAQTRLDQESLAINREDFMATGSYGPFTGAAGYMNARAAPDMGFPTDREEVMGAASVQINTNWSLFGGARYDLTNDLMITDDFGVKYSDDCSAFSVAYYESFVQDRDIKSGSGVMFRYNLKYLTAGQTAGSSALVTDTLGVTSAQPATTR